MDEFLNATFSFIGEYDQLPIDQHNGVPLKYGDVCYCNDNIYAYTGTGWDILKSDDGRIIMFVSDETLRKALTIKFGTIAISTMKLVDKKESIDMDSSTNEFWSISKEVMRRLKNGDIYLADKNFSPNNIRIDPTYPQAEYNYTISKVAETAYEVLNSKDDIGLNDMSIFYSTLMGVWSLIELAFVCKKEDDRNK